MVELEQQGAEAFFGEPEFDIDDLMQTERDGRGSVSVLELNGRAGQAGALLHVHALDARDALSRAARGRRHRQAEARVLLRRSASAVRRREQGAARRDREGRAPDSVEGRRHLLHHPEPQGHSRATSSASLAIACSTPCERSRPTTTRRSRRPHERFPKTAFYDVEETLTTLGIGEAFVTVLAPNGVPTPPFATRLIPPAARMGPLTDAEMAQRLASSAQVKEYATAIDRESARELLAKRVTPAADPAADAAAGSLQPAASAPAPHEPAVARQSPSRRPSRK